jgi:hypothetical protein
MACPPYLTEAAAGPEGPATETDAESFVAFVSFVVESVCSTAGRACPPDA